MTAIERQQRYRAQLRLEGDRRISIWVKGEVADALQEVANALSATHKHVIEKLLLNAKRFVTEKQKSGI